MEEQKLMVSVVYYSLFQKKIFEEEGSFMLEEFFSENAPTSHLDDVFGVFCTVRREKPLPVWPQEIHGCIGHWEKNQDTLINVYEHLLRVSHQAMWTDSRRQSFPPLSTEPFTTVELDFMMKPLYSIDSSTGRIESLNQPFTNEKYGILIQSRTTAHRATYLPGVFPFMKWKEMRESIQSKAGISLEPFDVWAYEVLPFRISLISVMQSHLLAENSIRRFSKCLLDEMRLGERYPFFYLYRKGQWEWNPNEDVRNISVLCDVLRYLWVYPEMASEDVKQALLEKVKSILQCIPNYSSQSLSFLGYLFSPYQLHHKKKFCNRLLTDLSMAENQFEKPQIQIGLFKASCSVDPEKYLLTYHADDSLFKMNWTIQTWVSMHQEIPSDFLDFFCQQVDALLIHIEEVETNLLAVAWEASCFLSSVLSSPLKNTIERKMFSLFFELENRKKVCDVFYVFQNQTARVDITAHVLNGFFHLIQ